MAGKAGSKWTSPSQTAVKTVISEGDLSVARPRLGATGEIVLVLNSINGDSAATVEIPSDVQRSRYFSVESQTCDFEIGTGSTAVDRELEKHLQNVSIQEKCNLVFTVQQDETYNTKTKDLCQDITIRLDCDLQMTYLLNAEPIYKWYPETKLDKARQFYSKAVELFKEGRYLDSFYLFQSGYKLTVLGNMKIPIKKIFHLFVAVCGLKPEEQSEEQTSLSREAEELRDNYCNNLAACHFKWANHRSVISLSTPVIQRDPAAVKALYRRGVSYLNLKEFDLSSADLVAAHKIDPSNRAVNEKLGQVKQRRNSAQAEIKETYSKMFS